MITDLLIDSSRCLPHILTRTEAADVMEWAATGILKARTVESFQRTGVFVDKATGKLTPAGHNLYDLALVATGGEP